MKAITIFLIFCSSSLLITSRAADTIVPNQTIRDGDTIVSIGMTYEMGFFSPENSARRYLGIWYYKIPTDRVVWVANREIPLNDTTGVLNFDDRGILRLSHNSTVIWSSNRSREVTNPVAQLLDSGNLVVRNASNLRPEVYLWQSFHEPGNTFLPGMKIGRSSPGWFLYTSCWKSNDDPAQGEYVLELDPSGLQLMITQRSVVTFRSGPWNGLGFSGVPLLRPNPSFSYDFIYNNDEQYFTYELINSSDIRKLVLNQNGVWERKTWVDGTNYWVTYSTTPADTCDTYKKCGAYGTCTIGNSPVCGCLNGFVPNYRNNWDRADWSDGCVRRVPLECHTGEGFIKYSNIKLPDMKNFSRNASMILEDCEAECLKNCACTAYTNSDMRGGGSGCLLWFGDLIDIEQYEEDGEDLYVKMPSSELPPEIQERSKSNRKEKVGIIVGSILSALLFLGLGLCLFVWKKKQKRHDGWGMENIQQERSMMYQDEDLDLPHFKFTAVAQATNNFSFNNLLGEGGFGPVYMMMDMKSL